MSFDNLALSQLNLRRFFTPEAWSKFFMGDEIWSRKKLAMVTLRELAPVTHKVLQEPALLALGTVLTDGVNQKWKVVEKRGASLILKGKLGFLPSKDYLETC